MNVFAGLKNFRQSGALSRSASAAGDRKRDLIHIQWFVAIACSYLLIVENGQVGYDPITLVWLMMPLASIVVILRLPETAFAHRLFPPCMVIVDTLLFFIAIISNRQSPWDLCLIFFFGILVAAIGDNLIQVIIGSVILGIVSVLIVPLATNGGFEFQSNTLIRIPLLFGASLVYGHLADQVKRERKRTKDLEELSRQQLSTKDAFISHVSHELRTPITAIYQFVTILSDQIAGPLNDEQREYLGIIERNVKQLQAMVGDLLEAARAGGNKLTVDPRVISLQCLIPELLSNYRASATVKNIALSARVTEDFSVVLGDPIRVKQVLSNLIDNAVKFTPRGGSISLTTHAIEEPRVVCVSVADTGCGIAPEAQKRVFDRLYQEEAFLNTNRKGLGLGLYLCHELITRQGGRIWVESEIGKGSIFRFTLPAFSLREVLVPFIADNRQFLRELAIVTVEVVADDRIESSEIGKAVWGEKWDRLNHYSLPPGTILLPRITIAGQTERFFLATCSREEAAAQFASRIEKDIGRHRRKDDAKYDVRTTVHPIPFTPEEFSTETVLDILSRHILELAGLRSVHRPEFELLPIRGDTTMDVTQSAAATDFEL